MGGLINFSAINETALDRADGLLQAWLPGGHFAGDEYLALNPNRGDRHIGSFSINRRTFRWSDFQTGDKGGDAISLYAFLHGGMRPGEAARALASELGLTGVNGDRGDFKPSLTMEELAAAKGLPLEFLKKHGVEPSGRLVKFTYYEADGTPAPRYRLRYKLSGASKYKWDKDPSERPVGIYGAETLHAFPAPVLHLTEGETDRLTGLLHGLNCLGLPGNTMTKTLKAEHLVGFDEVIVHQEPDQGGATFRRLLLARLKQLDFHGVIKIVRMPTEVKDLNGLHCRWLGEPGAFEAELAKLIGSADKVELTPLATPGTRVTIQGNRRQLHETTADAITALLAANDPPVVFRCGGALVRLKPTDDGKLIIDRFASASMRGRLSRVANWIKLAKNEVEFEEIAPPLDVAEDLLSLSEWAGFPLLRGVVSFPVFAPTGELICTPGYHAASGLYYHSGNPIEITAPERPTQEDVDAAKSLLFDELWFDFPLVDAPDKAHVVAAQLEVLVRNMIDGPTPLHMIESPAPGTGKGLMADCICISTTGASVEAMNARKDDPDEWRKRIFSMLTTGARIILIDNIKAKLEAEALWTALTMRTITDRVLGFNTRTMSLLVNVVWLATANNPVTDDEGTRRIVSSRLISNQAHPEERTGFKHPLPQWALDSRAAILNALITLVRKWIVDGMRPGSKTLGSYAEWARVIGGILDSCNIEGFLENRPQFNARANREAGVWAAFVEAWAKQYPTAPVGTAELFALLKAEGLVEELLGTAKDEAGYRVKLGRLLAKRADRVVGDWRLTAGGKDKSGRGQFQLTDPQKRGGIDSGIDSAGAGQSMPTMLKTPDLRSDEGPEQGVLPGVTTARSAHEL